MLSAVALCVHVYVKFKSRGTVCMCVRTLCYYFDTVEWHRTDTDGTDRQAFQGYRAIIREIQLSNSVSTSVYASTYLQYVVHLIIYSVHSYVLIFGSYLHIHIIVCIN